MLVRRSSHSLPRPDFETHMERFLTTETLIIELLLVVALVAIAVRRLRVPYTVALVIAGLLLTTQQPLQLSLTPELILALFVPPLVFEAAFHLNLRDLQRNLLGILLLAVPGVVLTMLIVGGLTAVLTPLALPAALVFGALISATDPVAVVALFRALGAPKRLALLMEAESLFNDGTAIVVFNIVVAIALVGHFNPVDGIVDFLKVSAGGLMIGFALGWATAQLIARIDDYLIETTLTTVLAFGSYLVAERLHVSGVLAVVAAGLVCGNLGPRGMSPTTRIVLFNFWEFVAFLANSFVFLLIGLQVNIPALLAAWQPVLAAIAAVLIARAIVIYGLGYVTNRLTEPIPLRWLHVMNWGGLRGAIALALALSLPETLGPDRELIRVMAFGVVLFTLLVQSTTMGALIRRLGIVMPDPLQTEYELRQARLLSFRSAATHLERMHHDGLISEHVWETLRPTLQARVETMAQAVRDLQLANPALSDEEFERARRELLRAQRGALLGLRRDGVISEEAFEKLVIEVDLALGGDASSEVEDMPPEAVIDGDVTRPA
jgi:CPA1 family monovalent cation:H+ antiporter